MIARLRAWWATRWDDRSPLCQERNHASCHGAVDGGVIRDGWSPCTCDCHRPGVDR